MRHYSSTGPCSWHSAWSQPCSSAHNFWKCSTWYTKEAFTRSTSCCVMVTKLASYPYQSSQLWATFGRRLQYLSTLLFGRATKSLKSHPRVCTYTVRMNTLIQWCTSRRPSSAPCTFSKYAHSFTPSKIPNKLSSMASVDRSSAALFRASKALDIKARATSSRLTRFRSIWNLQHSHLQISKHKKS